MSEVDKWINDKLFEQIGFSDKTLVEYIKTSGILAFR